MKKEKDPDRPLFYPARNWPLDVLNPMDNYDLLGVAPTLPPSLPTEPLDEIENL